ncbi:MAG: MoaD/ThiS family protein [Candidatus Thermoplasmatota archaeon]|nr:MoaD/ThiS family protein [Candidatus Thermoplasmatota archaeon]
MKLIGRYKDITGQEKIEFDITDDTIIRDIIATFVKKYPAVEKDKGRMMVIKNNMYTSYDTTVGKDDEIALSPPVVSGG